MGNIVLSTSEAKLKQYHECEFISHFSQYFPACYRRWPQDNLYRSIYLAHYHISQQFGAALILRQLQIKTLASNSSNFKLRNKKHETEILQRGWRTLNEGEELVSMLLSVSLTQMNWALLYRRFAFSPRSSLSFF